MKLKNDTNGFDSIPTGFLICLFVTFPFSLILNILFPIIKKKFIFFIFTFIDLFIGFFLFYFILVDINPIRHSISEFAYNNPYIPTLLISFGLIWGMVVTSHVIQYLIIKLLKKRKSDKNLIQLKQNDHPKVTKKKMRKILTIIVIISIIISTLSVYYLLGTTRSYRKEINRDHVSENEKKAIDIAETLEYGSIFNISRFDGDWANFIDKKTIDFYSDKVDESSKNFEDCHISLEYNAKARKYNEIEIRYRDHELKIFNNDKQIYNEYWWFGGIGDSMVAHYNNSILNITTSHSINETQYFQGIKFNYYFNNIYVIEMDLDFGISWGPLAAVWVYTEQVIVLDDNYQPLFIAIDPADHMVS